MKENYRPRVVDAELTRRLKSIGAGRRSQVVWKIDNSRVSL